MPSMSISPPKLSTGTTARISNGPCRLTDRGADVVETSSRVNFLYLYYYLSAIADGRMKEVAFEFPFFPIPL
jgi:hypothetical protein